MTTAVPDWKLALRQLKEFQDYTLTIQSLDRQLAVLDERRNAAAQRLGALQTALAAKQGEKEGIEKSRRGDERDVEADRVHLADRESKLYSIKTNKEYQAAQKEVADAKRIIQEREDRILAAMEALETLGQEITQLSTAVADTTTECTALVAELDAQAAALRTERDRECAARETMGGMIAPEAMKIYREAQRRFPDALGPVAHGVCCGCNMRIPPQRFVDLQQYKRLYDCPSCHRILYVESAEKN